MARGRYDACRPERPIRRLLTLVTSLVLLAVTAEGAVRLLRPKPRVQVVDPKTQALSIVEVDGVPLWWESENETHWYRPVDCKAEATRRIVIAGDSVLHSIVGDDVQHRLAERLAAALGPETCVIDASAGGYLPYQQALVARLLHQEEPIDVVVVDIWKSSRTYHRFGPSWTDTDRLEHSGDLPSPPIPMPAFVHRRLVDLSAAWRFATIATGSPNPTPPRDQRDYRALASWGEQEGVHVVFVEMPSLGKPFSQTLTERSQDVDSFAWRRTLEAESRAAGMGYLVVADALQDHDVTALRTDLCCHYNAEGHSLLAEHVLPLVREALAQER